MRPPSPAARAALLRAGRLAAIRLSRLRVTRHVLVVLLAAVMMLGLAGVGTHLLARRVSSLTAGGVTFVSLAYNPFTGRVAIDDLRAHDADGREVFSSREVRARLNPLQLLTAAPRLAQARLVDPRLTLHAATAFGLATLTTGFGEAPAWSLPLRVDDLLITGGSVVIETGASRRLPLVQDLDVRLGRSTTATDSPIDVAFATEMAAYGTTVYVTGQPRGVGYVLRVHARGLDAVALARDLPVTGLRGLQRGRGELDVELQLLGGRLLASGTVRLADVALPLPPPSRARFQAASVTAVVDRLDLIEGTGRIVRLQLDAPTLSVPAATAPATLAALSGPWEATRELTIRRVIVTHGTLALEGAGGVRLDGVQLAAQAPERDGAWMVSARAGLGRDARIALDGLVTADLRRLDATARMQHVALRPWRALLGDVAFGDTRVSFDGRLQAALHNGETAVMLAGPVMATRLGVEEIVPYEAPPMGGVPLRVLLAAIDDPARADRALPGLAPVQEPLPHLGLTR